MHQHVAQIMIDHVMYGNLTHPLGLWGPASKGGSLFCCFLCCCAVFCGWFCWEMSFCWCFCDIVTHHWRFTCHMDKVSMAEWLDGHLKFLKEVLGWSLARVGASVKFPVLSHILLCTHTYNPKEHCQKSVALTRLGTFTHTLLILEICLSQYVGDWPSLTYGEARHVATIALSFKMPHNHWALQQRGQGQKATANEATRQTTMSHGFEANLCTEGLE